MYCPKCKYEYPDSLIVCPDCKIQMLHRVTQTAGAAASPDSTWVEVGLVETGKKSQMAKGALNSNNIPSEIISSDFSPGTRAVESDGEISRLLKKGNVILVPGEFEKDAAIVLEAVLGDDLIETNEY